MEMEVFILYQKLMENKKLLMHFNVCVCGVFFFFLEARFLFVTLLKCNHPVPTLADRLQIVFICT